MNDFDLMPRKESRLLQIITGTLGAVAVIVFGLAVLSLW